MRKHFVYQPLFLFLCSLLFGIIFISCGGKSSKNIGAFKFDSIKVNRTVHLFADTAKPACNIVVNFSYIKKTSNNTLKDSINKRLVNFCFGEKYEKMLLDTVIKHFTDNYIHAYVHDLEPMYKEDKKNVDDSSSVGAWYSYYKNIKGYVQLYHKSLLVYRFDYNEFTGGAHGIYSSKFLNFDLNAMRPLQLSDLFIDDYSDELTDLIWSQLMADNKVKTHDELQDLGYGSTGDIAPTENFYLSDKYITFYYNVYDITPYVMGATEVKIPYEQIQQLLKKKSIIDEFDK
ncbi:MAG: RsiV family protein [Bacteroidaceae bacterium]|nr:RsiV family protein [Bacteroidaceae bacterium]